MGFYDSFDPLIELHYKAGMKVIVASASLLTSLLVVCLLKTEELRIGYQYIPHLYDYRILYRLIPF